MKQETVMYGLCTRRLHDLCCNYLDKGQADLSDNLSNLQLDRPKVNMYFRRPTNFRFPDDPTLPLIMIGPGTGVAPFIGFLQHRDHLLKSKDASLGDALLFYGCRYRDKDFLYRKEVEMFKVSGALTSLYTSFSRDPPGEHTRYVQENIKKAKEQVMELLFERNGSVFICGDAKHMGRDVTNLFIELIEEYKKSSKLEAMDILTQLRKKKQFLEDVWT